MSLSITVQGVGVLACLLAIGAGIHGGARAVGTTRSTGRGALLVGLGTASALSTLVVAHGSSAARIAVAVVVLLLVPGYALLGLRPVGGALDELLLALALSTALLVLVGTLMASVAVWEPAALVALSTLATAPVLTWRGARLLARERGPAAR